MNKVKLDKRISGDGHKQRGLIKKIKKNSKLDLYDPRKEKMDPFTKTIINMNKNIV